ncbi:MAG: hypothetical protein ACK5HS_02280, partial [Mycoplasmatales bacterium]
FLLFFFFSFLFFFVSSVFILMEAKDIFISPPPGIGYIYVKLQNIVKIFSVSDTARILGAWRMSEWKHGPLD